MPVSSASRPGHQTSAGSKWQAFPCGYLDGSDSAAVPNVHGLVGRGALLSGVILAFRAFQAALNSALAVLRSLDEPIGRPPPRWMVTLQSQTHGMRSVAKRIWPMTRMNVPEFAVRLPCAYELLFPTVARSGRL